LAEPWNNASGRGEKQLQPNNHHDILSLMSIAIPDSALRVPLHDNLGEDYPDNAGELGRTYHDNRGAKL
jgi:hypothetical protein